MARLSVYCPRSVPRILERSAKKREAVIQHLGVSITIKTHLVKGSRECCGQSLIVVVGRDCGGCFAGRDSQQLECTIALSAKLEGSMLA